MVPISYDELKVHPYALTTYTQNTGSDAFLHNGYIYELLVFSPHVFLVLQNGQSTSQSS